VLLQFQIYGLAAATVSGEAGMRGKSVGIYCEYYSNCESLCATSVCS